MNNINIDEKGKNTASDAAGNMQERILTAAGKLFSQKGFKATTTKMIAQEAGINEVTLFRNFQNKGNIFVQLINANLTEKEGEPLSKCLSRDIHTISEVEQMLVDFGILFYNEYLVKNHDIIMINMFEVEQRPQITSALPRNFSRIVDMLVEKLNQLQPIITGSDYSVAALIYVQSLIGTFLMEYRMKINFFPLSVEDLCKKASKVLLYGVTQK